MGGSLSEGPAVECGWFGSGAYTPRVLTPRLPRKHSVTRTFHTTMPVLTGLLGCGNQWARPKLDEKESSREMLRRARQRCKMLLDPLAVFRSSFARVGLLSTGCNRPAIVALLWFGRCSGSALWTRHPTYPSFSPPLPCTGEKRRPRARRGRWRTPPRWHPPRLWRTSRAGRWSCPSPSRPPPPPS